MLEFILAAGLALGNRPAQIVKPGEEAAYLAWLEPAARTAAGYFAKKDCSTVKVTSVSDGPVTDPIALQHPEMAFWRETFRVEGCGVADTQSIMTRRENGEWKSTRMLPGRSATNQTTQKAIGTSFAQAAILLASKDNSACTTEVFLKDYWLYNIEEPVVSSTDKSWTEKWDFRACQRDLALNVYFRPDDAGGTAFVVSAPLGKPAR